MKYFSNHAYSILFISNEYTSSNTRLQFDKRYEDLFLRDISQYMDTLENDWHLEINRENSVDQLASIFTILLCEYWYKFLRFFTLNAYTRLTDCNKNKNWFDDSCSQKLIP